MVYNLSSMTCLLFRDKFRGKLNLWAWIKNIKNSLKKPSHMYHTGCFRSGVYGHNCNVPCPVNCKTNTCHIQDGSCFGCKPGWRGATCNTGINISLLNTHLANTSMKAHHFSKYFIWLHFLYYRMCLWVLRYGL